MDTEKLVREGMSFAEITRKMNEEIAAAQKKIQEEKKAVEKAATKTKQLDSARKAFKDAAINYMNALGVLEDCNEKELQEIEKLVDLAIAATEKSVKIKINADSGVKKGEVTFKYDDPHCGLFDCGPDSIIMNFVKGLV